MCSALLLYLCPYTHTDKHKLTPYFGKQKITGKEFYRVGMKILTVFQFTSKHFSLVVCIVYIKIYVTGSIYTVSVRACYT